MPATELDSFLDTWNREAAKTVTLLRALPTSQYDFRPDEGGRSLGELAWHLAEGDAYMSVGIENGQFAMDMKLPGIERPRSVEALAQGYERFKEFSHPVNAGTCEALRYVFRSSRCCQRDEGRLHRLGLLRKSCGPLGLFRLFVASGSGGYFLKGCSCLGHSLRFLIFRA